MLILSRKVEQEILIGEDIKLTVVRIEGNRVRIGVSAPREIPVLRGELVADASEQMSVEATLSPREMAFAHPQATSPQATRPVGRLCSTASPSAADARGEVADRTDGGEPAELFQGTVTADGGRVQLCRDEVEQDKPAPLAGFVAAT